MLELIVLIVRAIAIACHGRHDLVLEDHDGAMPQFAADVFQAGFWALRNISRAS